MIGGEDVRMRIPLLFFLKKKGFSVGAVGCNDEKAFIDAKIPYYNYFLNRWVSPIDDFKSKKQLVRILTKTKPDLIHLFDTKPGILTPKLAKKNGIKFVVRTVTGMGYIFSSTSILAKTLRPFYKIAQKRAITHTDIVIFQNKDDQEYFENNKLVPKEKSILIASSGLQVDDFLSKVPNSEYTRILRNSLDIDKDHVVVILIARLVKDKGIIEYLEAAKSLSNNQKIKFLLAGPLGTEGKQAISKNTVDSYSKYVNYIGSISNVPEILSISNIFVLPTYYREGLPRILLEAGAIGLPLITTNMPGCRDVVKHKWNGLLVPIRNKRKLAHAIQTLSENKELREELGNRNPEFIKNNFDLSIVAHEYNNIYQKLFNK